MYKHRQQGGIMKSLSKIGDQKFLQELNRTLVINTIYHYESISRIEISKITKLSQSTVSNVVEALRNEGYVKETGIGNSTKSGGRKPTLISINNDGAYIVSVAIVTEAFHITLQLGLFDLGLNLIREHEVEMNVKGVKLVESMKSIVKSFIAENVDKNILGIGISVPTVLNKEGVIYRGHLLELDHYPLEKELKKEFARLPVFVEQEQHAAMLGERALGTGKNIANIIYVTVGRGIGSSVMVNNQLIKGANGAAGEIGHMSINKYGERCFCGKEGCLRLYATELTFINKIKEAINNEMDLPHRIYNPAVDQIRVKEVYKEAVNGDPFCRSLLIDLLENLCLGLSNLIHIINPERIIVGGNLLNAKEIVIPYLNEKLKQIVDSPADEVEVVEAKLGTKSSLYGAASIIFDKHFLRRDLLINR